jgi:DNA-binding NtrC family response regulator
MIRVLFIDDDPDAQRLLKISLPPGFSLISGLNAEAGVRLAEEAHPDVVLLDIDLPDADGFEVLERIHRLISPPPVIMLTGYGEIRVAVRSLQAGAADFIEKPYERNLLVDAIRQAAALQVASEDQPAYVTGFVGDSEAAEEVRSLIRRYATSDRPILITGESGTGKDLVARLIHDHSPRRSGPFVPRNCGAIPPTLVESELFGSERGAFTDAVSRPGAFELADSGTLFLDEIGEMPITSQAKLLRILEERRVLRIGGKQPKMVNVRIISATNRKIGRSITEGRLREDLYYRISTLLIDIPPLRERKEDIPRLVSLQLDDTKRRIEPAALRKLIEYDWPGNVRELHNVIERGLILCDKRSLDAKSIRFDAEIRSLHLPDEQRVEDRYRGAVLQVE